LISYIFILIVEIIVVGSRKEHANVALPVGELPEWLYRSVTLEGHVISAGDSFRRLTNQIGEPIETSLRASIDDIVRKERDIWFHVSYYFDGDYYIFYFSRTKKAGGKTRRLNPYDDSKLVYVVVTGGY